MPNLGPQDFSSYLLTHTSGDKSLAKTFGDSMATRAAAESEKASVISKLFDTLSVPLNTMVGIEKNVAQAYNVGEDEGDSFLGDIADAGKSVLGGIGRLATGNNPLYRGLTEHIPGEFGERVEETAQDLSGFFENMTPRETHADLLHDQFGVNNKIARYGGGFALDLVLDPLNLVGGLGAGKKIKDGASLLDAKAAVSDPTANLNQIYSRAKAEAGGLAKPNVRMQGAPSVAKQVNPRTGQPLRYSKGEVRQQQPNIDLGSISSPVAIPNVLQDIGKVQTPRAQVGTPLMDEALNAMKFQRRGRVSKGQEQRIVEAGIRRNQELMAQVEKGMLDIPNPARTAQQKLQRAQGDWERSLIKSGLAAEKGRVGPRASVQIARGMIEGTSAKNIVRAKPATGQFADRAREIADDVIDHRMGQMIDSKGKYRKASGAYTKRNIPLDISPGQQVALFNRIVRDAPKFEDAKAMLASAEQHMISLGVNPVGPSGTRVRLSDVMEMVGDQLPPSQIIQEFAKKDLNKMDPIIRTAVNGLEAQRSVNMSEIVSNATRLATQATDDVLKNYSGPAAVVKEKEIVEAGVDQAIAMGMTHKESKALKDLLTGIVNVDKLPVETWVTQSQARLMEAVSAKRVDPKLLAEFNKQIEKSIGIGYKELGKRVSGNRAVDTAMLMFTTHYGRGETKRFADDVFIWGQRNAEARAELVRRIAINHSQEENISAMRMAQGLEVNADPRVVELSNLYKDWMTRLFRSVDDGITKTNQKTASLSVAQRTMTMMEDVNRHLAEAGNHFQFTNSARARDFMENAKNYSQGTDWMRSWERWDHKDPVAFMYDLDLALEKTVKEYVFMDDFLGRYGSLTKTKDFNFLMQHGRMKGFYVPESVGKEMLRVLGDLKQADWSPKSGLGKFYASGLNTWKRGVTIYLPSHHVRNAIGDMYLMWLAGHSDPREFIAARRIMHSQRTRYKEAINSGNFDQLDEFTDSRAMQWAETREDDVIINVNGTKLTTGQMYIAAHQRGLLLNANRVEDIFAETPMGTISVGDSNLKKVLKRPLGGKAHQFATEAAEYREHFIRLAHFNAAVKKELKSGKRLKDALDNAAHEVRKWHPDGRDLTQFEQKLRMIIPFYSWVRKSTPLLIQSLVTQPAKVMVYPKMMQGIQGMVGIEGTSMLDPYPDDQLFPDWIRGYGIGPIGDAESDNAVSKWFGTMGRNMINLNGDPYGYTIVNPSNPTIDMFQQFGGFGPKDTAQGVVDSLTPFAKVPYELATGRDFTGGPIYKDEGGRGVLTYLSKQIPFTGPLQRVSDLGEKERKGIEPAKFDHEAMINMLTAMGVRGTSPYIKSAEFEALERERAKKNG